MFDRDVGNVPIADIPTFGRELCVSDGTPPGTQMIVDLDPGFGWGMNSPYLLMGYGDPFLVTERVWPF